MGKHGSTHLDGNISFVCDAWKNTPLRVCRPDASILLWVDCSAMGWDTAAYHAAMRNAGIEPDPGHYYFMDNHHIGAYQGPQTHFRLNIGAPRAIVEEAIRRLKTVL